MKDSWLPLYDVIWGAWSEQWFEPGKQPRPNNYVLPQKDDRNYIPRHKYAHKCQRNKTTYE